MEADRGAASVSSVGRRAELQRLRGHPGRVARRGGLGRFLVVRSCVSCRLTSETRSGNSSHNCILFATTTTTSCARNAERHTSTHHKRALTAANKAAAATTRLYRSNAHRYDYRRNYDYATTTATTASTVSTTATSQRRGTASETTPAT